MANKSTSFAESTVWKIINIAGISIMMNLTFILFCLPVVTIPAATCGLYSAIRFYIRGDGWFKGFIKGFTTNIWRMLIIGTVLMGIIVIMFNDLYTIITNYQSGDLTHLIISSIILAIPVMLLASIIVFNVYFPNTTINLLSDAATFCFMAPLQLLLTGVLMWAPVGLAFFKQTFGIIWEFALVFIAVYFAVIIFASTVFLKDSLISVLEGKRATGELPPKSIDDDNEM